MRSRSRWISLALILLAGSCDRDADRMHREIREAVDATKDYTFTKKEEFVKTVEADLNQLETELGDLKTRAAAEHGDARQKLDGAIATLRTHCDELRGRLGELRAATEQTWGDVRDRFRSSMTDLKHGIEDAWDDLKN